MIRFVHKGDFGKTEKFLSYAKKLKLESKMNAYGEIGVNALASATPKSSGKTASSWDYKVEVGNSGASISWSNSNVNKGVNIAVILNYGHGTGTGGYVAGREYISPAIQPIFDEIVNSVWGEVTSK